MVLLIVIHSELTWRLDEECILSCCYILCAYVTYNNQGQLTQAEELQLWVQFCVTKCLGPNTLIHWEAWCTMLSCTWPKVGWMRGRIWHFKWRTFISGCLGRTIQILCGACSMLWWDKLISHGGKTLRSFRWMNLVQASAILRSVSLLPLMYKTQEHLNPHNGICVWNVFPVQSTKS